MQWELDYGDRLAELALRAELWWIVTGLSSLILLALVVRGPVGQHGGIGNLVRSIAGRLRALRAADSATASIEFLLVLFPFLVIVMTIWQLAFMFNAQLHVGYAAYAAARSASIMIPAQLDNEAPDQLKRSREASGGKWDRIRRAAIPGTLAISPGDAVTAGAVVAAATGKRFLPGNPGGAPKARVPDPGVLIAVPLWVVHYGFDVLGNLTRLTRAEIKAGYASTMTEVLINGSGEDRPQTIATDTVEVRVNYAFWLHVPYVGRLMEALFDKRPTNPLTGRPIFLNPYPSMNLTERIVMTNWRQKCAIAKYCP